jgi:hypothetical protein
LRCGRDVGRNRLIEPNDYLNYLSLEAVAVRINSVVSRQEVGDSIFSISVCLAGRLDSGVCIGRSNGGIRDYGTGRVSHHAYDVAAGHLGEAALRKQSDGEQQGTDHGGQTDKLHCGTSHFSFSKI